MLCYTAMKIYDAIHRIDTVHLCFNIAECLSHTVYNVSILILLDVY